MMSEQHEFKMKYRISHPYSRWIWGCLQGSFGEILSTPTRYCGCEDFERLAPYLWTNNYNSVYYCTNENFANTIYSGK